MIRTMLRIIGIEERKKPRSNDRKYVQQFIIENTLP